MFTNFVLPCAMQLLKCDVREEVVFVVSHFFFLVWVVRGVHGWVAFAQWGAQRVDYILHPIRPILQYFNDDLFVKVLFSTHVFFYNCDLIMSIY
jgi:hypothetical protein